MNVSVPAITKSLSNLEESLGLELVDRKSYRITLNQYGKHLVIHAHGILTAINDARNSLLEMRNNEAAQLRINVAPIFLPEAIPKTINRLKKLIPGSTVRIENAPVAQAPVGIQAVIEGRFDVLIYPSTHHSELSGVSYEPLARMTLRIIASPNHPASALTKPTLTELSKYDWIIPSYKGVPFEEMARLFRDHNAPQPKSLQAIPTREMTLNMLKQDDYLALIPCNNNILHLDTQQVALIDIDCSNYGWTHFIIQRKTGLKSQLQEEFVREIKAIVANG